MSDRGSGPSKAGVLLGVWGAHRTQMDLIASGHEPEAVTLSGQFCQFLSSLGQHWSIVGLCQIVLMSVRLESSGQASGDPTAGPAVTVLFSRRVTGVCVAFSGGPYKNGLREC